MADIDNAFARHWADLAGIYCRDLRRLYHNIKALDRYYIDNVKGTITGAPSTDIVLRNRTAQGIPDPSVSDCLAARATLNQFADLADESGNQITVLSNFDIRLSRLDPSARIVG